MYINFKKYGFIKTTNKQILNRVNKLIKKHKNELMFKDGLWEIRILNNDDILAVYNDKERYYIKR